MTTDKMNRIVIFFPSYLQKFFLEVLFCFGRTDLFLHIVIY